MIKDDTGLTKNENSGSISPLEVFPGGDIQRALDAAAADGQNKHVVVHAGFYRPKQAGQAFLRFNRQHDGIVLEAEGDVTLSARNKEIADSSKPSYPAIVNHVVYFGDGISRRTVLRGFKITGANNFVQGPGQSDEEIESEPLAPNLQKGLFFYTDGGGIKVFGRSYPTIENVEVLDNYSSPCGAGVSIEHQGYTDDAVMLRSCIFRNNSCPITGSAVDLLEGSSAIIRNCLFVGNRSNCKLDKRSIRVGKWKPKHGAGALTVFPASKVIVRRCTFTGNRNAVDDSANGNTYEDSIFWMNTVSGGWPVGNRYELDIKDASGVRDCFINGAINDVNGTIDATRNHLGCDDPQFDGAFVPTAAGFENVGYRP